jgi:hypothetical protein
MTKRARSIRRTTTKPARRSAVALPAGRITKHKARVLGLVNAAMWLLYLDPDRKPQHQSEWGDVTERLLASQVPAVQTLVGNARHPKTLRNLLAPHRQDIMPPLFHALTRAAHWAEDAELRTRKVEEVTNYFITFAPVDIRSRSERDAVMLARAVERCAKKLPPDVEKARQRILQRQAERDARMTIWQDGWHRGRQKLPG